jgi:hypothetical protein
MQVSMMLHKDDISKTITDISSEFPDNGDKYFILLDSMCMCLNPTSANSISSFVNWLQHFLRLSAQQVY